MGKMMMGSKGGPGSADPGHITYTNLSLKNLLVNAYDVKGYQISGPAWLDSERFDVVAKVPQGATKEQVRIMMQNLLQERFKLVVHHETKEMPMYALVVGKGGPKMKVTPDDPPPPAATGGPSDDAAKPPAPPDLAKTMGKISVEPDGTIKMPKGFAPKNGCMNMMMGTPNGPKSHMQCSGQTMSAFASQLSNQMDKPVTDQTNLTAKYDFALDFTPDENRMAGMLPAGASMAFSHEVTGGPEMGRKTEAADTASLAPLPAAIQEQLGLKLEQKKGPVDLIVIDKIERVPTEN